jgi:DNA-directed RNA polymerase specialized sigma24 family protein
MLASGPGIALENMALTPQQCDMDICGRQLLWLLQNEEVLQQEIRDLVEDVIAARYSRHGEILRHEVADDVLIKVRDWCAKNPETAIECVPAFIRAAAYRTFADIRRRGRLRSMGADTQGRISGYAARHASLSLDLAVAFEMVPEPYRTAGSLKFFEGLTDQELADNLGISLGVLQHRLARCRNVLRAVMLIEWAEDQMEARGMPGRGPAGWRLAQAEVGCLACS